MCGFSARTVAALQALGAPFAAVDILPDPRIRQELSALSQWPTIPQLFVNGELVGGCDIVTEMYESGELAETLGVEQPAATEPVERARGGRAPDGHREPPVLSRSAARSRAVRCRHVRRDAAPPGPALGRARAWPSSTRRACPAPRCGSRSRARPTPRRPSGASRCAARRSSGSPPPTGWRWRSRASPASARWSAAGSCCARRARPPSTSPTPSTACAPRRWRPGRPTMAGAARDGGRAHPRRGGRRLGRDRRPRRRPAGRRARGSPRTATPARWRPAARGPALAVILALHERGAVHVLAGETRPLLQGARLTVWELARAGVEPRARGRRRDGRAHPPRRGRRGRSSAPTASPPTATRPTRSAPTPWRWPRARPASRSSSPPRRRPSTASCPTATASRSRSATATRSARFGGAATTLPGTAVRNPAFDVTPGRARHRARDRARRRAPARRRLRSPRCWHEGRALAHPARRARRGGGGPRARPRRRRLPRAGVRRLRLGRPRRRGSRARCRPSSATSWRAR